MAIVTEMMTTVSVAEQSTPSSSLLSVHPYQEKIMNLNTSYAAGSRSAWPAELYSLIADSDFRRALMWWSSDDILLNLGSSYISEYPELLSALAQRGCDFTRVKQEQLGYIVCEALTLSRVSSEADHLVIKLLLQAGLDPNFQVEGQSMLLLALQHNNLVAAKLLVNHPRLENRTQFLSTIDNMISCLIQLRQDLIANH